LVAVLGMAAIPAVSDAVQPAHSANLNVTVKPHSGAAMTHFRVSFRAPATTGRSFHSFYRIDASRAARPGCQSAATVVAPPTKAGSTARVVLAPGGSERWCAGTFHGQVWDVLTEPCPIGVACPALVPRPRLIGKFSFRVTRG
jgi:hypothetical protein